MSSTIIQELSHRLSSALGQVSRERSADHSIKHSRCMICQASWSSSRYRCHLRSYVSLSTKSNHQHSLPVKTSMSTKCLYREVVVLQPMMLVCSKVYRCRIVSVSELSLTRSASLLCVLLSTTYSLLQAIQEVLSMFGTWRLKAIIAETRPRMADYFKL